MGRCRHRFSRGGEEERQKLGSRCTGGEGVLSERERAIATSIHAGVGTRTGWTVVGVPWGVEEGVRTGDTEDHTHAPPTDTLSTRLQLSTWSACACPPSSWKKSCAAARVGSFSSLSLSLALVLLRLSNLPGLSLPPRSCEWDTTAAWDMDLFFCFGRVQFT